MGKTILVTGGCGFLGSHVCEYFHIKGWNVIAYDNMTKNELMRTGFAVEEARVHNKNFLDKLGIKILKADVCDFDQLIDCASDCDFIVHTAAQPAMTISWEDPRLDFMTNGFGTFNVLEVARRLKIPIVSCATVHVYGNGINDELVETEDRYTKNPPAINEDEKTLTGILTPLHGSKAIGDIYTRIYIDTYKTEAASFRLTGIYGTRQFGGEDHGWVANFAIRSVVGWPCVMYGKGKQVRDIIYATDVCEAFEAFYNKRVPGIYNIGGGEKTAISLLDCINILGKINGKKPEVRFDKDRHGDLRYFICDITKAQKDLGWSPKVMPEEGIGLLMEWIKNNKDVFLKG